MEKKYEKMIEKFVKQIVKAYKEPLDGDQTEEMTCLFHVELDWQSGNITSEEYEKRLSLIKAL